MINCTSDKEARAVGVKFIWWKDICVFR